MKNLVHTVQVAVWFLVVPACRSSVAPVPKIETTLHASAPSLAQSAEQTQLPTAEPTREATRVRHPVPDRFGPCPGLEFRHVGWGDRIVQRLFVVPPGCSSGGELYERAEVARGELLEIIEWVEGRFKLKPGSVPGNVLDEAVQALGTYRVILRDGRQVRSGFIQSTSMCATFAQLYELAERASLKEKLMYHRRFMHCLEQPPSAMSAQVQ
jgi:hypothetical protein